MRVWGRRDNEEFSRWGIWNSNGEEGQKLQNLEVECTQEKKGMDVGCTWEKRGMEAEWITPWLDN